MSRGLGIHLFQTELGRLNFGFCIKLFSDYEWLKLQLQISEVKMRLTTFWGAIMRITFFESMKIQTCRDVLTNKQVKVSELAFINWGLRERLTSWSEILNSAEPY